MAKADKDSGPANPGPRMTGRGIAVLGGDAAFPLASLLRRTGVEVLDADPPPEGISATLAARYGFGHASLRAGRLDHLRQVRQLVEAALSDWRPRNGVWLQPDGSLIDGLRATVDPQGLADPAAARAYPDAHLACKSDLAGTRPEWH